MEIENKNDDTNRESVNRGTFNINIIFLNHILSAELDGT